MNFVSNRSFGRDRTFIDLLPTSWFQLEINHNPFYTSLTSSDREWIDEHHPPVIRYDRPVNQRVSEFRLSSFSGKLSFLEEMEGISIFHKGFSEALKRNPRYQLLKDMVNSETDEDTKTPSRRKKTIPKALRASVWHAYIGQEIGMTKCPCCETSDITPFNFECGHIMAETKGGSTTIDNLRPICGTCNRSMGTMEMNEFIQTYFPKEVKE